ncbi:FHA domain-containing protein [Nocardia sp. NBC_01730]|uniref:FHA domain-containing protein n=1 Tax=Nocardia sp. NBC_01730 TaxID=2975998 RepID=UPI002E165D2E|nr:FHA domain-containing protein [Nocardia sp. NBC_01730]
MDICPDGHLSLAPYHCDVCGKPVGAQASVADVNVSAALCPSCGAVRTGRFCEVCGRDSALARPLQRPAEPAPPEPAAAAPATPEPAAAEPPRPVAWIATIVADREFYDRVIARKGPDVEQVGFPTYYPERRIVLHGSEILIGKRSVSQGIAPEIDLGIAPADIGVSRAHAMIHVDGRGLTVTDLGSTNGTSLNGSEDLLPPKVAVSLRSGDRIHLGGWTTITLSAEPA